MKKLIIILAATLISWNLFSQNVKIDKKTNLMSIDNVDVARFLSSKNANKQDTYLFTDLKSDDFVKLTNVKIGKGKDETGYLQVVSSLTDKTSEMDFELLSFTLSMNSAISNLIVKKYNFFTPAGMNKDAIVQFLNLENKNHKLALEAKVQEQQEAQAKIDAFAPSFKDALTVINNNNNEVIINLEDPTGKFNRYRDASTDYDNFIIKDREGNRLGTVKKIQTFNIIPDYSIETYDKQIYRLEEARSSNIPMEAVKKLILNGYLGDGDKSPIHLRQLRANAQAASAAAAKAQDEENRRRQNVTGILTLKDGQKIEGAFRFDYRQTEEGRIASERLIGDLDAGKYLFHYYKDEKGKDKIKKYGVKEVATFYINDNEIYESVTYKRGNTTQKFLLQLAVTEKARLYFYGGEYILMKPGSEDAIIGKTLDTATLAKFTSDCPEISQKIANNGYGNNTNSYIQLVKDYTKCN